MRLVCLVLVGLASLAGACRDEHRMCAEWAHAGACERDPARMLHTCKVSCHLCPEVKRCSDVSEQCKVLATRTECSKHLGTLRYFCPRSCELCPDECKSELKPDIVIEGKTVIYGRLPARSWVECCKMCQQHDVCSHWSWSVRTDDDHDSGCQLKCGVGKYVAKKGAMSGRNREKSGETINCTLYHYDCPGGVCDLD